MNTLFINKSTETLSVKWNLISLAFISLFFISLLSQVSSVSAQTVLFDFDNAPLSSPLPVNQTVNGITAHFSATGQGYSIQNANTMGFTPLGFAGRCIYPSSINLADLLIKFDQKLTDFSIMYSCQELGCDDAATMRVTAYLNGSYVGTNTKIAANPGTWPVDKLSCSFLQGFDSVVVHYDNRPPTCQDYGVIFLADNMMVTPINATTIYIKQELIDGVIISNPVSQYTTISFSLLQSENINITIFDIKGKVVKNLFAGKLNSGEHMINWDVISDKVEAGVYFLKLTGGNFSKTTKIIVMN
jgi:hypothetical protein